MNRFFEGNLITFKLNGYKEPSFVVGINGVAMPSFEKSGAVGYGEFHEK
jgi:hypothetical protein